MTSSGGIYARKRVITEYLSELRVLANDAAIDASSLSTLDVLESIRRQASSLANQKTVGRFVISFSEKQSERFSKYVDRLHSANGSGVYIWTPRTNVCGLFMVPSIRHVSFAFPFNINNEGILSLVCTDLSDRLLLEFSVDDDSHAQILEVETQGKHWTKVLY